MVWGGFALGCVWVVVWVGAVLLRLAFGGCVVEVISKRNRNLNVRIEVKPEIEVKSKFQSEIEVMSK